MRFFTKFCLLLGVSLAITTADVQAQSTRQFTVMLEADISKSPAITIRWKPDENAVSYQVYRRLKPGDMWSLLKTVAGDVTEFTDATALRGTAYEYQVLKTGQFNAETYYASGYIYAGAEVYPDLSKRGALILIDESLKDSLGGEIFTFENDLRSEGWAVSKAFVPRAETFDSAKVVETKKIILTEYNKDKSLLKSVVLVGRVAVPYSGDIYPDGHGDHKGAWPCDGYYGDIHEALWTDTQVNVTTASRQENKNSPGDGKFDQSNFPSSLELAVGRIDMYNMTDFKKSEIQLLKGYFVRNHEFRTAALQVPQRGLIDDNFGSFVFRYKDQTGADARYIEAFASSAIRSWSPLIGADNIIDSNYITNLDTASYLWAYACGGGGYQGASGVGSTGEMAKGAIRTIFSGLFGSYFGDWDVSNSFLRAPLCASPGALTNAWVGRPHWYFHRMGLGETIGVSELLSQNNYEQNNGQNYVSTSIFESSVPNGTWYSNNAQGSHIALMGDPTLVMQPVERTLDFASMQIIGDTNRARLSWNVMSPETATGYFIYRTSSDTEPFIRLNDTVFTGTEFEDRSPLDGVNVYKVVAVKQQTSPSGSYYIPLTTSPVVVTKVVLAGVDEEQNLLKDITLQPNPASDFVQISFKSTGLEKVHIEILDVAGNSVTTLHSGMLNGSDAGFTWDLLDARGTRVPAGVYLLKITVGKRISTQKIVVMP